MKRILLTTLLAALSVVVATGCGRSEKKTANAAPVRTNWDEDDDLPPEPEEDAPPVSEDDLPPTAP